MKNVIKMSLATAVMMTVGSVSVQAADGFKVFDDIKFSGELRPRYQYTDNDQTAADAGSTFTNRTNLNFSGKLLEVDGLKATVELNAVSDFGTKDGSSDKAAEATVGKVSQAKIEYGASGANLAFGRSTTNLDNQRWIGSVGWKQNFQTLDLASVAYKGEGLDLFAAYVYGINAIGDDGNGQKDVLYNGVTGSGETNSAIVNASYTVSEALKLTAYAYMIGSFDDTYGVALTGKAPVGDVKLGYRAEYATQTDPSLSTSGAVDRTNVGADYMNFELNANISGILVGANYEVLGADKTSINTHLATKHKFNGWVDKFLRTPDDGLIDTNLMVGYTQPGFGTIKGLYHMFESDKNGRDYGTEFDVIYVNKIPGVEGMTGMLKAGFYSGDDGAGFTGTTDLSKDASKVWAMLDYKFSI